MSLRDKVNSGNSGGSSSQSETFINTDLTEDYNSGREFIRQRVKAFGAGMKDEMELVQKGMKHFSGGKFVIAQATYERPALPPSDEQASTSLIALLYGQVEVVNE